MDVLAINGSPHTDGNTAYALDYAAQELARHGLTTECLALAEREIHPCRGCFSCRDGACVHDDDMTQILALMRKSRCVLLGSPVYMGLVSGQMKVMMDRSVAVRIRGFQLSGRLGAGIACGGFRNGGQELTLQCMHTFFLQQDMHAVADGPGYSHSGATIVGKAKDDDVGLTTIRNMTVKIATMLGASGRA